MSDLLLVLQVAFAGAGCPDSLNIWGSGSPLDGSGVCHILPLAQLQCQALVMQVPMQLDLSNQWT